jgi:hypothetical protein
VGLGMWVKLDSMVSAGRVAPDGQTRWVIAFAGDHKTLKAGDVVVMTEGPGFTNLFVRPADLTVHAIQGEFGYVVVTPAPQ